MDPGAKGYGNEYGGAQNMRYQGGGTIPAFADDGDEYDDLYNDVNVGKGFQHMQQPMVQMQSARGFHAPQANPDTNINRQMGTNFNSQNQNLGFQGSNPIPVNGSSGAAPVLNPGIVHSQTNMNVNQNRRPVVDNGATMLFVGELHWWTTDAALENVLSQYGRVKEIKFFDERVSGKSKGFCQVEFYDSVAAAMCKEGMNGHVFNGRACVVDFSSPQTMRRMGSSSYANKNQAQTQFHPQGRRPVNDDVSRGGGINQQGNNNGGRGGWGRGGPGMVNRGPGDGQVRGRGGPMGGRSGPIGGAFGTAFGGPVGGMMGPPGMMGAGFDPTFMGFPGPTYPGMMPSFSQVNPVGLTGVPPHMNPAFFGSGMTNNGMGMMRPPGMVGQQGMWNDTSMGGEEYEDGGSEYGYGDGNQEKGVRSNNVSREEWGSERSERKHRDERDVEKERSERTHRYREENDDWDRGQSSRSRSRSRAMPEEDYRRSRDVDYGKRRRE